MRQELLGLTPKRILCPYCGTWHEVNSGNNSLDYYDSNHLMERECNSISRQDEGNPGRFTFYFQNGCCYYYVRNLCTWDAWADGSVSISEIVESEYEPKVTFSVNIDMDKNSAYCDDCKVEKYCNIAKLLRESGTSNITIKLGFEFDKDDYSRFVKLKQRGNKEETTMANNNIFNLNMEFGQNNDENIVSTILGIAVKSGENWRIYDKVKKEITDIGNIQPGNLPIFIIPTTKLAEGDLIKDSGEYYFVMNVENGSTKTLCARTGELKTVIPVKNILGFSCYSKVIAISDAIDMNEDFEKLAVMSAMCGQGENGCNQMNQMIPLILFKDKLGADDDMAKMLFVSSMAAQSAEGDTNINQMIPLILFKDKLGADDEMSKMLLVSAMMGAGATDSKHPILDYFTMEMFMKFMKKKDEPAEKMQVTEIPQIEDKTSAPETADVTDASDTSDNTDETTK